MTNLENEVPAYRNEEIGRRRRLSRQPFTEIDTEATSTEPATSTSLYDMATQRINNNES